MQNQRERIRARYKELRARLSPQEISSRSERVRRNLLHLPEFERANCIGIYLPKPGSGEVDTFPLLELAEEKKILVPWVDPVRDRIFFSEVSGPSDLEPGFFGIPEPKPQRRKPVKAEEMDVVLVPGICFDLEGRRLGFGRGYYDRFLAEYYQWPGSLAIGVAYEFQVLEKLPEGSSDQRVSILVTDECIRYVANR